MLTFPSLFKHYFWATTSGFFEHIKYNHMDQPVFLQRKSNLGNVPLIAFSKIVVLGTGFEGPLSYFNGVFFIKNDIFEI